jgi:ubiquinone biosynthesis protein COQ9
MAAKKSKKKPEGKDFKTLVVESALELAAEKGWGEVTLRAIAERSGVSLAALREHFADREDILCAFGQMIDRKVLEGAPTDPDDGAPMRERLFDLLMDRFEILNDTREGVKAVLKSFRGDPKPMLLHMPYICRSMGWMLEAAGADTNGISGRIKVAGLTGIYLKVLCVWAEDESPDLPKTMAALDQALGRAEAIMNTVKGRGKGSG